MRNRQRAFPPGHYRTVGRVHGYAQMPNRFLDLYDSARTHFTPTPYAEFCVTA